MRELQAEDFPTIDPDFLELLEVSTSSPLASLENNIQPGQSGGNGSFAPHDTTRMDYWGTWTILNPVESTADSTPNELVPSSSQSSDYVPPLVENGGSVSYLFQGASPLMTADPCLHCGLHRPCNACMQRTNRDNVQVR